MAKPGVLISDELSPVPSRFHERGCTSISPGLKPAELRHHRKL
jgi:hypothetical protein